MLNLKPKIQKDQTGLAAIIVTLILMTVITLIVLGFARLSRREQRQTLDDQLSTQAFYAAESGVNDAIKTLQTATLSKDYTSGCSDFITDFSLNNILDSTTQYSCLLVNRTPGNLKYDSISTNASTVVPIDTQGANLASLTIGWQDTNPANNTFCPNVGEFKASSGAPGGANWPCNTGVVRADLVLGSANSRSQLNSNVMTMFLYPAANNTKNPLTFNTADSGAISGGTCNAANTPTYCKVTINFSGANQQSKYYLRLKSIYFNTAVTITGTDTTGAAVKFVGAQATIDATGKANDVLRRIQVRVPLNHNNPYPEFAIQTGDNLCKRLQVTSTTSTVATDMPGVPACDPFN